MARELRALFGESCQPIHKELLGSLRSVPLLQAFFHLEVQFFCITRRKPQPPLFLFTCQDHHTAVLALFLTLGFTDLHLAGKDLLEILEQLGAPSLTAFFAGTDNELSHAA
jgi:hypothetical protein